MGISTTKSWFLIKLYCKFTLFKNNVDILEQHLWFSLVSTVHNISTWGESIDYIEEIRLFKVKIYRQLTIHKKMVYDPNVSCLNHFVRRKSKVHLRVKNMMKTISFCFYEVLYHEKYNYFIAKDTRPLN